MRRFLVVFLASALGFVLSQGVREAGMGGVLLPGIAGAEKNPAYAALGQPFGPSTYTLPLGVLGMLLPDRSPLYYFLDPSTFYQSFDLASFLDQASAPNTLLLNPAKSPEEVVIELSADGIRITDGKGNPLSLQGGAGVSRRSGGLVPPTLFRVPFDLGTGIAGSVGVFLGSDGVALEPDAALSRLLAGGGLEPNQTYALTARGSASGGLALDFAFAQPLPLPGVPGTLYLGARGQAFLGLLRLDARVTHRVTTDDQAQPATRETETRTFYVYPGQGIGYGGQVDLGLAYAEADWVVGLGVKNALGFATWQGTEEVRTDGGSTTTPKTETQFGFDPAIYLSGAGHVPLEEGGRLLLASDLGYDGAIFGHLGAEYPIGPSRVRAGIGYDRGLVLGTGAGFELGPLRLDLALTGRTSPWDGHLAFGLQAGIGF